MKHRFHYFHCLFICITLINCKHKCERDPEALVCPGCKRDQSIDGMMDYYYFKTGTYWIYEEVNSGVLDTVTVYYDYINSTEETSEFQWKSSSTYFQYNFYYTYNESFSAHCLSDEDCTCHKILREKSIPGDYIGGGRYFLYPIFQDNYTNPTSGGSCIVEATYSFYPLIDELIQDVARVDVPVDESTVSTGQHTKYWWAKNIGIIEFENLTTNQHWYLIERNIIQ